MAGEDPELERFLAKIETLDEGRWGGVARLYREHQAAIEEAVDFVPTLRDIRRGRVSSNDPRPIEQRIEVAKQADLRARAATADLPEVAPGDGTVLRADAYRAAWSAIRALLLFSELSAVRRGPDIKRTLLLPFEDVID